MSEYPGEVFVLALLNAAAKSVLLNVHLNVSGLPAVSVFRSSSFSIFVTGQLRWPYACARVSSLRRVAIGVPVISCCSIASLIGP